MAHNRKVGRNQNIYFHVNAPDPIELSSTEWTMVLDEFKRLGYRSSNDSNTDFYIFEGETPPDSNPRGFIQWRKTLYISMDEDTHHGKIWMLAKNGSPEVIVDEF